ncbi:MAG: type I DNA topoisomerase [Bacteroidales bacterium]|jgi:DNA topoisomerase-1|nr:type I DNA topoisomerase [Bacteroidales bacterium]
MANNLVIVESPAKAKTIEKFLGADYKVTSSYGHIRDLKKHDFSIDIENKFQPIYEIPSDKQQLVSELKKAAKKAEMVWLASDEDREGEAISWHLSEVLELKPEKTRRIVFHEITKNAILNAIKTPREIDQNLVNAQTARRVLDRIVGFELSPVLWRKVKPQLSAGRVQSVAVRLIVEREREIQNFKSEESYRVTGTFAAKDANGQDILFNTELNQRFKTKAEAEEFLNQIRNATFEVKEISQKPLLRQPAAPFTTSTLQQEASRKLRFSVSQTMSIAQRLYEAGKITYMRTDSVNLSTLCLGASKEQILATMGEKYLKTRNYITHSKGAQEAHEAIRPTYMNQTSIEGTPVERRLYELIWKRTIASQMSDAQIEKTTMEIAINGVKLAKDDLHFVATGEVIKFDGFLKVYMESNDDETLEADRTDFGGTRLPNVQIGTAVKLDAAEAIQRFSQHPPRYTEASLVKKMEELGIGRPSTYAPTISTIQQREYVEKYDRPAEKCKITRIHLSNDGKIKCNEVEETVNNDRGKLVPTDIGLVVNDYLSEHFPQIMSYDFTATVEGDFDKIADGKMDWTTCLGEFYEMFHPLVVESIAERMDHKAGERVLGTDPKTGYTISVKISRFGPVVQIGAQSETDHPQFASLQKGQSINTITLDEALKLFQLPKTLGEFEGFPVVVGVGRYGPYVQTQGKYVSIPKGTNPLDMELTDAVKLIESKRAEDSKKLIKTFDEEPELQMLNGRFGPYLARNGKNYRLPRNRDLESLTYADCIAIIEAAEKAAEKKKK